jgi:hypothetical protein
LGGLLGPCQIIAETSVKRKETGNEFRESNTNHGARPCGQITFRNQLKDQFQLLGRLAKLTMKNDVWNEKKQTYASMNVQSFPARLQPEQSQVPS